MSDYDLRTHLNELEKHGLLKRIKAEVDKDWELSAVSRMVYVGNQEDSRYATLYENVKGFDIPVVVGAIGGSYKTYAVALGVNPNLPRHEVMEQIREKWINALDKPLEPVLVEDGPVHENVITGDELDVHMLPVPVWTPEKDRGWDKGNGFLTSPYHVTKDPETGIRNVGTYRTMFRDEKNILGIAGTFGAHIWHHIKKNEENGNYTEIATVIGCDPTVGMTSVTDIPYGMDELAVAGALRGEPLRVVKCKTVDIEVPASAEIVIEGRLLSEKERPYEAEAPFGEYTGYQGSAKFSPVYEVTAITYRNNPIFQGFISQMPPSESSKVRHIAYEAMLLRHLKSMGFEGIVDINIPETTQAGVVIVSIRKQNFGQPARIASAIFAALQPRWGKFIIVTDDDIDVYDLDNVLWAMTFRTSLTPNRRRIHFFEGLIAQVLDYSCADNMEELKSRWDWPSEGVLIDATRPYEPYPVVSLPPQKYLRKAIDAWEKYGLPELEKKEIPRCIQVEEEYLEKGIAAAPKFVPLKG